MAQNQQKSAAKESFDDIHEPPSHAGRSKLPFDENLFKRLCQIQCSKTEIASVMDISTDTLERRIKELFDMSWKEAKVHFSGKGKAKLRELQFRQAESSASMSIWLGKQYLGQTDKVSHTAHNELENISDEELELLEKEIQAKVIQPESLNGSTAQTVPDTACKAQEREK